MSAATSTSSSKPPADPTSGILGFWAWFAGAGTSLREAIDANQHGDVAADIREQLANLHPGIGWEIGPGSAGAMQFAISPNGDRNALPFVEQMIAAAPGVPGWEFHAGKPPKESWDMRLSVRARGQIVELDAAEWLVDVVESGDATPLCDLTVYAPNTALLEASQRDVVAMLVVEAHLGERLALQRVSDVAVSHRSPDNPDSLIPMRELRQRLAGGLTL